MSKSLKIVLKLLPFRMRLLRITSKAEPLIDHLEKETGLTIEFIPVTDYAAAVEALVNRKVDMAWYGGFTFVQAKIRSGNNVIPIIQRVEDEKFQSVFITTDPKIKTLADLKGVTFSFGSQSSTSGHLMPRTFLAKAGINPEEDFKRTAYSGAHDATVASVGSERCKLVLSTSKCGRSYPKKTKCQRVRESFTQRRFITTIIGQFIRKFQKLSDRI